MRNDGNNERTSISIRAPNQMRASSDSRTIQAGQSPSIRVAVGERSVRRLATDHLPSNLCPHCQQEITPRRFAKHIKSCPQTQQNFLKRLSKCPVCGLSFLKQSLAAHMTKSHGMPYGTPGNLPITLNYVLPEVPHTREQIEGLIPCKKCEALVYPHAMKKHIQSCHSPEAESQKILKTARMFSFVLLPVGTGKLRDAIEGYRSLSRSHPHSLVDVCFDWERLERIERLDPIARYVGVKLWKGYVVFEFARSNRVILESPQTGNATYVLAGQWREMISSSKADLRSEYGHLVNRIIHKSGWARRVRQAVFGSARSASNPAADASLRKAEAPSTPQ
jgi:hypothetical protein